jgi:AcrR family transcriptional regulator
MSTTDNFPLDGRRRQAALNDDLILKVAKEVFVANASAPIAAVAERAGVGIGALYRRYPSKEVLLATLCAKGQETYIAEAERALADTGDPWNAYVSFLCRIVAEDTHSLSSRLAGTFMPTEVHAANGIRLQAVSEALFTRTQKAGRLRADVTLLDIGLILEALAQLRWHSDARSAEIRQRLLTIAIDGLRAPATTPITGAAPTWQEQNARWMPKEG